ncbi:MAG: hypothetical protein V5A82_08255 [Haloferacaceae archaeon]|jgi:hypothetical protein
MSDDTAETADDEDHPARQATGVPTPDDPAERYETGEAEATAEERPADDQRGFATRVLDLVPVQVVALGAGFLLASTVVTFIVAAWGLYTLVTGAYASLGFPPTQVLLLVVTFGFATVFQAIAVRWARRRVKWTWVMLACAMGTVSVVASPLALPASLLLFVGKRHFTMSTPFWVIRGDDGENEDAA